MDLGANEFTTFRKVTLPLIAPAILSGLLLSFALSVDDFVVTYFNAGSEVTFPLFVWGAAQRGVPPQVNVMGTVIFVVALGLMLINVLVQRRREGVTRMSTEVVHAQIDSERVKELTEREARAPRGGDAGVASACSSARAKVMPLGVPSSYHAREPVADLPRARRGRARLGRRRPRALGLPQRLRLDGHGPRASGDRRGDLRARQAGDALRGADRGRDRRRGGAGAALRPAQVALHELGLRGDDGRDPDRARPQGARHDHEDLRLVPRAPRRRDGRRRRQASPR